MTRHRISFWSGAGCLAWGLMGCSVGGANTGDGAAKQDAPKQGAPSPVSGELRNAPIPSTFTFATTRGVTLKLDADRSLFRARDVAGIEVTNAAHALLFQGPIHVGHSLVVPLSVPTKDNSINVTFRTQGVELTRSVVITGNRASQILM